MTAIFAGLTSGAMSCPKLKIGFVSPLKYIILDSTNRRKYEKSN
jgi:hypothetical protein